MVVQKHTIMYCLHTYSGWLNPLWSWYKNIFLAGEVTFCAVEVSFLVG
jgi:hypothetical protein